MRNALNGSTHRMEIENLIGSVLGQPTDAIAYHISRALAQLFPDRAMIEGPTGFFDVESFAAEGLCTLTPKADIHSQLFTSWDEQHGISKVARNAWFEVEWRGHGFDVLQLHWHQGFHEFRNVWILAETEALVDEFFTVVSQWNAEIRDEVLVFDGGCWHKSGSLFRAIQGATFDNLVLQGTLKEEIRDDLLRFFEMQGTYKEHGVPWKRGILFLGPPGNGKTHTVKALINAIEQPCLYVKSFQADYATEHDSIRAVFKRARETAPCILVLEDLDSLLNDGNRSFFLNELDGFAANTGIVTLATTNHPERLDISILDRPSRFDRKYHFELPAEPERRTYISLWNETLGPRLQLTDGGVAQVAQESEGFSFAYLKELFLSSMMRWIATPEEGAMDQVMLGQIDSLREQMVSTPHEPSSVGPADPNLARLPVWLQRKVRQAGIK